MNNYKGIKIASVYGQGLEGCGVTRTSAELELWAKKSGAIAHTFAYTKSYSRSDAHVIEGLHYFGPTKRKTVVKTIEETAKLLNEYDIVMFMNYPNAKSDLDYYKSFYYDLYLKVQKPKKALYIHEIRGAQYNRLAYLVPMIVNADIVFHFDTTSALSTLIDKMGLQKIKDRLHKYTLWMNFNDLDNWRLKYINDKTLGIVSVTRWSSSKNVRRSLDIMDRVQKLSSGWSCRIKGIERSMGAKNDVIDYDKAMYINTSGKIENEEEGTVKVSGPVNRNEGIDEVSSHLFSTAFWSMPKDPENYGNRMEYTQIEIIGAGTIPIFDKHWGENNYTRDGRRYIDIPYSAVYAGSRDEDEINSVVDQLMEIAQDADLTDKYLTTSRELVLQEFDADVIIPEAVETILGISKNKNQLSVYDICKKFVNEKFADEMQLLEDDGKQPVYNFKSFTDGLVLYLEDKKEVVHKKIKIVTEKSTSLF